MESKGFFVKFIISPYTVLCKEKLKVFIWGICTFLGSLSGIIIEWVFCKFNDKTYVWLEAGNFYVITLSLMSCSLGMLISDFEESEKHIKCKNIKKVLGIIMVIFMIITVIAYISARKISCMQLGFFVIAIFLTTYVLSIDLIKEHDEYAYLENRSVDELQEKANKIEKTEDGVKL